MSTLTQFIGGRLRMQEFTASGTFVVPAGVTSVWVTMCGGGGSGAVRTNTASAAATGGGSGFFVIQRPVSVTSGASITVTIGAGGTAVSTNGALNGNAGGDTSFGSLTVSGGQAGLESTTTNVLPPQGGKASNGFGSGASMAALLNFSGTYANGLDVNVLATTGPRGSGGGGGLFGVGGDGTNNGNAGSAAANSGGGGGGNATTSNTSKTSGAGGSGRCIVEWIG